MISIGRLKKGLVLTAVISMSSFADTGVVTHDPVGKSPGSNSLTNSGAPFEYVAGNCNYGPIVAGGYNGKQVWRLSSFARNSWHQLKEAPFIVGGIAGEQRWGPIVTDGSYRVAYLNSYSQNIWKEIDDKPAFKIEGLSGNNDYGPVIFGGASKNQIGYIRHYSDPRWKYVNARSPFELSGISGHNRYGVVGFGGEDNKEVAYLRYYSGGWVTLPDAPYSIVDISGDNKSGPTILTDVGMIYRMTNYKSPYWQYIGSTVPHISAVTDFTGHNDCPMYTSNNT